MSTIEKLIEEAELQFRDSQDLASTDPFCEILKQFLRTAKTCERCQLDLNDAVHEFNSSSSHVWQSRELSVTLQGVCGDKNKVSYQHIYTIEELNETKLSTCSSAGKGAVSAAKSLADCAFDSLVSVSRVDVELLSFLNELKEDGSEAYYGRRVYQIIGVLFQMLRTCSPDDSFAENIVKWVHTCAMNSLLLPNANFEANRGRLLLLIHILRVHNAFVSKLVPLIQPPMLTLASSSLEFPQFKVLYFSMLKSVLSKPTDRAQFLSSLANKSILSNNVRSGDKFVFVDEFDGGTGVSLQPADMEEPSLIRLLGQFEIYRVLSLVFSDTSSLRPEEAFAFGKELVAVLFVGLTSYNSPPFRGFIKSVMFHICEALRMSQHFPDGEKYEAFFMETFDRFASELKFGFSILWVNLPYEKLSVENKCRIFCRIAGFSSLPTSGFLRSAKEFSQSLLRLPLHDSAYLLNVCLAIASTQFADDGDEKKGNLVACIVATELYISHLLPSASDVIWKITKLPFCSFVSDNPSVISRMIETISSHLDACNASSNPSAAAHSVRSWFELSDFFKSLDYSKYQPDELALDCIQTWLIHSDITSGEYLIAKDTMNNLAWNSRGPGLPSFLPQSYHRRAAITILEWTARNNLPVSDRNFAWSIMLRLQLINRNPPQSSKYSVSDTVKYVKAGEPLACYAAFLMSPAVTTSIEAFISQGLPLIRTILDKRYPSEAIYALLLVLSDYYTRSALEKLLGTKDFIDLIDRLLTTSMVDIVKGWAFEFMLPKDILIYGIVSHMRSMNAYMVLEFWLCILGRCSEGFQKAPVMDALELLLSLTPALQNGLPTLNSVLSKHYSSFVDTTRKHVSPVRALVSWIVGLPFSLVQSSPQSSQWPWFCITSLSRDLQTEFESTFSLRFLEQILASPSTSLDKIFKQSMSLVEEANGKKSANLLPTSADNMAIFRLAQFASQADPRHSATPLAWLLFFRAFLRKPTWSSKGCGYILLHEQQSTSKKQLVAGLTSSLKTAADSMAAISAASHVAKECQRLYSAMLLWLDEPRLHMENFDPNNLPAAFLPEVAHTLIHPSADPWPSETLQGWLMRFVDLDEVLTNITLFAEKFRGSIQPNNNNNQLTAPAPEQRDLSPICDPNPPAMSYTALPEAAQYSIKQLFPDITEQMCQELSSAIQILMVSLDAVRVFSSWVSEQESAISVACEHIVETLPRLCTYETFEERISRPCNTLTSYIRPCTSPAVLVARYRRTKRIPSQEAALNQYASQVHTAVYALSSLMSPSSCQSPVQIAVAAIRLESLISKVVSTENAEETGRSLYYTVATFIDNNPSLRETAWDTFLSQCLEMLGQTFIRTCEAQQKEGRGCLLETVINSIKSDYVRRLMITDFMPSPLAAAGLVEIIATAITAGKISPNFAFLLLSKFEVNLWLATLHVERVAALLGALLRCIVSCLSNSEFSEHMLVDMLVTMVDKCLAHNFPDMLHSGIERFVLVTEAYPVCALPPPLWNSLLVNILGSSEPNCVRLSISSPLTLEMIDRELRYLTQVFAKVTSRFESSPAWKAAVAPLSLIAGSLYCLAVDRAVVIAKETSVSTSSFDMYRILMELFGPLLVFPPRNVTPSPALVTISRPAFAAFGDCLLHLQTASCDVQFANTSNLYARVLQSYVEDILETASTSPMYAKEIHACLGRLPWSQFVPENNGQVELLEMLCSRDGISAFWTGTVCSIDWNYIARTSGNFSNSDSLILLISSVVRMGFSSVVRCPRKTPLGDLVAGCLVESVKKLNLELLPLSVYSELCSDVRSSDGRFLPPQVVFAWASNDPDLQSLKDCLFYLETISCGFSPTVGKDSLSDAALARSYEFLRLIGLLLFDCLSAEAQHLKQSKLSSTDVPAQQVIAALCRRCEVLLTTTKTQVAARVCQVGLEPLNQSVAFANRLLPGYAEFFAGQDSQKCFTVYWLSSACRTVTAASVAIDLAETLLKVYRQFSPGFSWETAQTLVAFASCHNSAKSSAPTCPSSPTVSYSSMQSVQLSSQLPQENQKRTALDEFILLGGVAANHNALLVVQALARRAITAATNFDLRKATLFTISDIILRCCKTPNSGDVQRLLGLWSLWLTTLVEIEASLANSGVKGGPSYGSLAFDLSFVARLAEIVTTLTRLGEARSTRGLLGAIGFGTRSVLPPWFHLFARGLACLLTKYFPDCLSRAAQGGSSSGSSTAYHPRQILDSLTALRTDREYSNYAALVKALVDLMQDNSLPFNIASERLLSEFRSFNC